MLLSWVNVVVIVGSPSAEVRPFPTGAVSKTIIDLHLELFLDETKKLAQSVVECVKENGAGPSIDEVIGVVYCFSSIIFTLGVTSHLYTVITVPPAAVISVTAIGPTINCTSCPHSQKVSVRSACLICSCGCTYFLADKHR